MQRNKYIFALLIIVISIIIRVTLLNSAYKNLRHGSAALYGSAAIGLLKHSTLTTDATEISSIYKADNLKGDYLTFEGTDSNRAPMITFLPGPAFLLYLLWDIIPVYNFSTIIYLQILIEAISIALIFLMLYKIDKLLAWVTAIFLILNIIGIKRTLMAGYDFWPQFGTYLSFILIYKILTGDKIFYYFLFGFLNALLIWFREINMLLVITGVVFIFVLNMKSGKDLKDNLSKCFLLLLIFIASVVSLAFYRTELTDNSRPTRSTFWHAFLVGVGQFDNPYKLVALDDSPINYALNNDSNLMGKTYGDVWEMTNYPNSEYEIFAKRKAMSFINDYPLLFLRNILFRTIIIVSPFLYSDGDFIPISLKNELFYLGLFFLLFWVIGIIEVYRFNKNLFYTIIVFFINTVISFSWWYVVGRVIIPILFLHFILFYFSAKFFFPKFQSIYRKLASK